MCMRNSCVRGFQQWNWAGDEIVFEPVVEASRFLPDGSRRRYRIDLREFLGSSGNAVVRGKLRELINGLSPDERDAFRSNAPGSFDKRATILLRTIRAMPYQTSPHRESGMDAWYFPEETLFLGGGDCEDKVFLLAALMLESGISSYCVRVAFGHFQNHLEKNSSPHDHAWLMYKNEGGAWEIFETVAKSASASRRTRKKTTKKKRIQTIPVREADIEYVPHFVMNREHLWRVRGGVSRSLAPLDLYLRDRRFFEGFSPAFGAKIHRSILDEALGGSVSEAMLEQLNRVSLLVDVNVLKYDPRDHFDFSYIVKGWRLVQSRLKKGSIKNFGLAAHGIADFYAHTLYAEFAGRDRSGNIVLYNPDAPPSFRNVSYDFSKYELPGSSKDAKSAAKLWKGRLISGQWWRFYTTFPDTLENAGNFWKRRCLPDHDEIAVDTPEPKGDHRRYSAREHKAQFGLRYHAAIRHIREAYKQADAAAKAKNGWRD